MATWICNAWLTSILSKCIKLHLAYDWIVLGTVCFFPRTKPYLNTNKRRHIFYCLGPRGSSMATWKCHAWLTSILLKCTKLSSPCIRLDCSGYSLVFPHTKPYLNTNKRRQILCCLGTQGSSMATWICHAWLTSVLSKCTKLLSPCIRLDCSGYSLVFPCTKPYLNTNKRRHILCCLGTLGSSMATWICHTWLTSVLSKCAKPLSPCIQLDFCWL